MTATATAHPIVEIDDMSNRTKNALRRAGHNTLEQIAQHTAEHMRRIPNYGDSMQGETSLALWQAGLDYATEEPTKRADEKQNTALLCALIGHELHTEDNGLQRCRRPGCTHPHPTGRTVAQPVAQPSTEGNPAP